MYASVYADAEHVPVPVSPPHLCTRVACPQQAHATEINAIRFLGGGVITVRFVAVAMCVCGHVRLCVCECVAMCGYVCVCVCGYVCVCVWLGVWLCVSVIWHMLAGSCFFVLAQASSEGNCGIFDVVSGKHTGSLRAEGHPVMCIDVCDAVVLGGSNDRIARVWDAETERLRVRVCGNACFADVTLTPACGRRIIHRPSWRGTVGRFTRVLCLAMGDERYVATTWSNNSHTHDGP